MMTKYKEIKNRLWLFRTLIIFWSVPLSFLIYWGVSHQAWLGLTIDLFTILIVLAIWIWFEVKSKKMLKQND